MVSAGGVLSGVGEIQVLRDQASPQRCAGDGEVFLRGRRGKRDRGADVVIGERRKILEDLPGRCPFSQAGQYRAQRDARALDDGFSARHTRIADDTVLIVERHGELPPL